MKLDSVVGTGTAEALCDLRSQGRDVSWVEDLWPHCR